MDNLKAILAPVDFSPCSDTALKQALRLGREAGAAVTVLHAVQPAPIDRSWLSERTRAMVPTLEQLVERAQERMQALTAPLAAGVAVNLEVAGGHTMATILDYCERLKPDLLVLGAHSSSDARRHMGYIASGAIRRAAAPVLAVHPQNDSAYRKILVATDFSETAHRALRHALRLAQLDGAEVEILHVYSDPWAGMAPPVSVLETMPDFAGVYTERVQQSIETWAAAEIAAAPGVKIRFTAMQHAKPVHAIVEHAAADSADLIVMGTKGSSNLRYLLLGSTAEGVLRRVPCSVLAVKPRAEA